MEVDEVRCEPGDATERKGASIVKRVLNYFFPPLNEHYARIINGYDGSKLDVNYSNVTYDVGDD